MADPSLASTEPAAPAGGCLNPAALSLADAAKLLAAAGGRTVTVEMLQAAVDRGAPIRDGRVNLVELLAWLERELAGKNRSTEG
jgi:hypothetical protein